MRHLLPFLLGAIASATLLVGCSRSDQADPYAAEVAEREAYVRKSFLEADAGRALNVGSTSEIQFDEGISKILYDPPDDFRNHAFRWMGQNGHVRLKTHGDKPMKLLVAGWIHEKVIRCKAVVTLYIDGQMVGTSGAIEDGHYRIETIVPASALRRPWVDLSIRTSAVAYHWSDVPLLNVVVLYNLGWKEAD